MSATTSWRLAAATLLFTFACVGSAPAQEERGIDPNQGKSLVEVTLASKGAATRLQLDADKYGIDFNEHYLRRNSNGTVTASVFGGSGALQALEDAGFDIGATIEGPNTWRARAADRRQDVRQENRAEAAAEDQTPSPRSHGNELVVLRADFFENYAGRFLSVEAKTRLGGSTPTGATYTGPALSLTYNKGPGRPIDSESVPMDTNIDPDTTPDTYIEHRELVRVGDAGSSVRPTRIRIGSSSGATIEAPVEVWLGGGLPPMKDGYLNDFTTRYMDPSEVYQRFDELADEFSNIAELITLPHKTNGYQRRAQALMEGNAIDPGAALSNSSTNPAAILARSRAVVLTSRAWGHEGGNDIHAEFVNPGVANAPLEVAMAGNELSVRLATDAGGQPSSTAKQVVDAINADANASRLLVALTYRGNAGDGVVQPRTRVPLSDFLSAPSHVQRGPYEYSVMRITGDSRRGKHRKEEKVGVFLYCQQHAREWATPLTCLETAEQLLRNYAIDKRTRDLVDNLEIYILPSSNPDGGHYSMHDFNFQRRNLTNHCVVGGKETDDPFASNFWQARTDPLTGQAYVNSDPGSRNAWGVDLNRNNTFGTIYDGYIGASTACNSDVFAGPSEASEPEIKNELWIADTFDNIKFSNNIHSFGGYFMWAPGTYLPDRGEGDAVHANIGVEKYFFEAGDRILNRIKEERNTVILPERTGPIADVLYSAAGNSADEHWYKRGVIAYSFETGADRFADTFLTADAAAGQNGIRVSSRAGIDVGDRLLIGKGTPQQETRTVLSVVQGQNPPSPQPNVRLTEPLANSHPGPDGNGVPRTIVAGPTIQQGVGFQPDYDTEGKFEALEFARGNYGLLESALEYARDDERPKVRMTGPHRSRKPIETTFEWINEPSVIRYTTDGSRPRSTSRLWDSTGPREPGETFHVRRTTTFRWIAEDIKGNVSTGKQTFVIGRGGGHDDDSDSDD